MQKKNWEQLIATCTIKVTKGKENFFEEEILKVRGELNSSISTDTEKALNSKTEGFFFSAINSLFCISNYRFFLQILNQSYFGIAP